MFSKRRTRSYYLHLGWQSTNRHHHDTLTSRGVPVVFKCPYEERIGFVRCPDYLNYRLYLSNFNLNSEPLLPKRVQPQAPPTRRRGVHFTPDA